MECESGQIDCYSIQQTSDTLINAYWNMKHELLSQTSNTLVRCVVCVEHKLHGSIVYSNQQISNILIGVTY
jgi:hypothetical protein